MGTVSKQIADDIIKGLYDEDRPLKIVKYTNMFDGGDSYGVINYGDDLNKYAESEFVRNPTLYWEKKS